MQPQNSVMSQEHFGQTPWLGLSPAMGLELDRDRERQISADGGSVLTVAFGRPRQLPQIPALSSWLVWSWGL